MSNPTAKTDEYAHLNAYSQPKYLLSAYQELLQRSQRVTQHLLLQGAGKADQFPDTDPLNINEAVLKFTQNLWMNPQKMFEVQTSWWQSYFSLLDNVGQRAVRGNTRVEPLFSPAKGDKRFNHDTWNSLPWFDFLKQLYLMNANFLNRVVNDEDLTLADGKEAKKIEFYTRQLIDAFAPSNFLATNPEALYVTVRTNGANLLKGMKNFLEDLDRGKGNLNIRMTDLAAFQPGKNIAVTAGKVVFQNDLMQLIQYSPLTEDVYQRPLLIVPPWINKYYILDLRPDNSFIRWAVSQGHTVFVISWVNPDAKLAHKGFENYMLEGPLAALDAIEQITGEKQVNAAGYCLGGTLLATTLAYLAAKNPEETRISSATFFTTLLDFEHSGELDIFIDDAQLDSLEAKMNEKGYLDGSEMATTFTLLRANDLIWSFHVNNYLLGKDPAPFDLLYWNSDATRMPAKMHSFYLRNMYQKNLLKQANGISLNGVGIDLSKITIPAYFISAQEDHIAPWKSTYAGAQLFSGDVKFVLGGSGHIAGIINPPAKNKYFYYLNPQNKTTENTDTWLAAAKKHEGSWWTDWTAWIAENAGEKIPARDPSQGTVIEDAPGSYVKVKVIAS